MLSLDIIPRPEKRLSKASIVGIHLDYIYPIKSAHVLPLKSELIIYHVLNQAIRSRGIAVSDILSNEVGLLCTVNSLKEVLHPWYNGFCSCHISKLISLCDWLVKGKASR